MKNWKRLSNLLLAVTTLFFILTTLTFYFYVNKINNNYQVLLKKELNNFQSLQRITIVSNKNYFLLFQFFNAKAINADSIKKEWNKSLNLNSSNFDKLSDSLGILSKQDLKYKNLINARAKYLKNVDYFLDHISNEDKTLQTSFFVLTVNPSFTNYQDQLNDYTLHYSLKLSNHSNEISYSVASSSLSFILFGFSPLIFTLVLTFGYFFMVAGLLVYIFFSGSKLE